MVNGIGNTMTANTCPTCTDTPCPACQAADTEYQAWANLTLDDLLALLARCLDDMDDYNATDRYNAEQWAREGGASWYSGDRVGR